MGLHLIDEILLQNALMGQKLNIQNLDKIEFFGIKPLFLMKTLKEGKIYRNPIFSGNEISKIEDDF